MADSGEEDADQPDRDLNETNRLPVRLSEQMHGRDARTRSNWLLEQEETARGGRGREIHCRYSSAGNGTRWRLAQTRPDGAASGPVADQLPRQKRPLGGGRHRSVALLSQQPCRLGREQ